VGSIRVARVVVESNGTVVTSNGGSSFGKSSGASTVAVGTWGVLVSAVMAALAGLLDVECGRGLEDRRPKTE
jgi:hypothetical protein